MLAQVRLTRSCVTAAVACVVTCSVQWWQMCCVGVLVWGHSTAHQVGGGGRMHPVWANVVASCWIVVVNTCVHLVQSVCGTGVSPERPRASSFSQAYA